MAAQNGILTGGTGRDRFIFRPGDGIDRITDFKPGIDSLGFDPAVDPTSLRVTQNGRDTVIIYEEGSEITLVDVQSDLLGPGDIFTIA